MNSFLALALACSGLAACSAAQGPVPTTVAGITLSDGPRLSARRATHALVRTTDGLIVALGGCVEDGCEPGAASATVDVFAADGRAVVRTGRLLVRRVQPSAAQLPNGQVLVIGGWVDGQVSETTEIFDPAKGRSRLGPRLAGPRSSPTVVQLDDDTVLIAGGYDGRSVQSSAQLYEPRSGKLRTVGALRTPRSGATGTLLPNGQVLLAGGGNGESDGRRALDSAELFDPLTGQFRATGSLVQRRYKHGAVALPDGDVLIIGGSDERDYRGKLRTVERYNVSTGQFVKAGSLAVERFKLADGVLLIAPNKILVAAGDRHPEVFYVAEGKGLLLPDDLGSQWNYMTVARIDATAALLAGGYREGLIQPTDRTWRFALRE